MVILHLALQGGFHGMLRPWVEADGRKGTGSALTWQATHGAGDAKGASL